MGENSRKGTKWAWKEWGRKRVRRRGDIQTLPPYTPGFTDFLGKRTAGEIFNSCSPTSQSRSAFDVGTSSGKKLIPNALRTDFGGF